MGETLLERERRRARPRPRSRGPGSAGRLTASLLCEGRRSGSTSSSIMSTPWASAASKLARVLPGSIRSAPLWPMRLMLVSARSSCAPECSSIARHERADSHLLPHHRHRPVDRVLQGARLRGDRPHPDPRRGRERLHEPPRRRRQAAPGADLQLRRRLLRPRHGLRPHRDHGRRPRRDARATEEPRASSPRSRPTRCARAARACASCATPTATGSS